jgi:glycolate oxidase FAD binding subunit
VKDAGAAVRSVMSGDLVPVALDVLDGDAARVLGIVAPAATVIAFDGLREQIDWQTAELSRLVASHGGRVIGPLAAEPVAHLAVAARAAFSTPAAVVRMSALPAQVADSMEQGAAAARARGFTSAWAAHAGVGVVTAALAAPPRDRADDVARVLADWRTIARATGGAATLESAPLAVKAALAVWDDAGPAGRIMQRIKAQLDPKNVLNPGRFVAGI